MVLCWMICLVLECASLRLITAYPRHCGTRAKGNKLEAVIYLAGALCRAVWYMSRMSSLAYAKYTTVFLGMALKVFEEGAVNSVRELIWTQGCLVATAMRMKRLVGAQKRTLCCVDELGPGFTNACRCEPSVTDVSATRTLIRQEKEQ